jgi:hypothetical protein
VSARPDHRPLRVLRRWRADGGAAWLADDWTVPADYLEPVMRTKAVWRRLYLDLPRRGGTEGASWITTNDHVLGIVLQVLDRVIPESVSSSPALRRWVPRPRRGALSDGIGGRPSGGGS